MTDEDLIKLIQSDTQLNRARQHFSNYSGKIEQGLAQRVPLSPIEVRKLEVECVLQILHLYGIDP